MDPTDSLCSKCGRFFPYGHSCSSAECNEDSTSFLDKVVKERKFHDESDDKPTSIGRDFTAYDIEEFQDDSLDQTDGEWDSSHLHSLKQDPLISEGNTPISLSIEENFMGGNQEEFLEVTYALGDSFENTPEFLPILPLDILYSDESSIFQSGNPLDGLPFESLVTDDSSVSDQRRVQTTDSLEKQSESSPADIANAIRELRVEIVSEDNCGGSALNSFQVNDELQSPFDWSSLALLSCSPAGSSSSDRSGHSNSKFKQSPLKHSPQKEFQCDECGKILPIWQIHKSHKFSHMAEKPSKCKDCGGLFTLKYNLKTLNRTHSGDRPYQCTVCSKKFTKSYNLKRHFNIHTGEQPFACLTCGRPFTFQSDLCRHRRSHSH